ncbi:unnamed protein product [Pieris macdunnoughi]|uniref:Uncharacterized protein n=1 Tax=Pieris macdunnoughi TaxID=345717 RepID=A0A821X3B9_9NEOP|nr:unnamed protein product [Pieris macdunnoughi]
MSGDSKRFYVNEHLTPDNKHLLKKAKGLAIDTGFKYVLSTTGAVSISVLSIYLQTLCRLKDLKRLFPRLATL